MRVCVTGNPNGTRLRQSGPKASHKIAVPRRAHARLPRPPPLLPSFACGRGLSDLDHRDYFAQHPAAVAELKTLLANLGLGTMNLPQLTDYFRQAGLHFGGAMPAVPSDFIRSLLQVPTQSTRPAQRRGVACATQRRAIHARLSFRAARRTGSGVGTGYESYSFGDVLTAPQKHKFFQEGYILMRRIVRGQHLDAALRDINRSLSYGYSREQRALFDRITWCPEVQSATSILDLLYMTPALGLAMSLIGSVSRVQSGVIQVRVRDQCAVGGEAPAPAALTTQADASRRRGECARTVRRAAPGLWLRRPER